MKRTYCILAAILILVPASPLAAADFGLLLDAKPVYEKQSADDPAFTLSTGLSPWFSSFVGEDGDLYLSARAGVQYENNEWTFYPELSRTELAYRFGGKTELKAGRTNFADPTGFVASGLFDGAALSVDAGAGTFKFGAFYTGFLYKKTANITMTESDKDAYEKTLDYGDFVNTYFAPKRVFASIGWEHPALAGTIGLKTALIGQFDVTGESDKVNTQYLSAKLTVPFYETLVLHAGGAAELMEWSDESRMGFMADLGLSWLPAGKYRHRLSIAGRYSSGRAGGSFWGFLPISTHTQGAILRAKLSGLAVAQAEYSVRLHPALSAEVQGLYFFRTDLETYAKEGYFGPDGYLLGAEAYGRLTWAPVSDFTFTLGGGAFIPRSGDAAYSGAPVLWRVEVGATIALF